jgi:hypothetical protein
MRLMIWPPQFAQEWHCQRLCLHLRSAAQWNFANPSRTLPSSMQGLARSADASMALPLNSMTRRVIV